MCRTLGWTLNRLEVKFPTPNQRNKHASHNEFMGNLPKFCLSRNETYPKFTVLVCFRLGQIYPLKAHKILLKVTAFQNTTSSEISTNTILGPKIFCKLCATALYHNNTWLAPLKNFSRSIIEQNENIASYNFKIFPWLTRNFPNSFYSFENYLAEFLRIMHHAFFGCHYTQ